MEKLSQLEELAQLLIKQGISISSIESFTTGGFANMIGSISGISAVYRGSLVSYQTRTKRDLLNIDEKVIAKFGVVSIEVSQLMVLHGKHMFDSDLCISFTGNAGPTAMEGKPVGLVFISIAYKQEIRGYRFELSGSREEIKKQAILLGIEKILDILKKK